MPFICRVSGCNSKSNLFYPNNEEQMKKWKEALGFPGYSKSAQLPSNYRVCGEHFSEDLFNRYLTYGVPRVVFRILMSIFIEVWAIISEILSICLLTV